MAQLDFPASPTTGQIFTGPNGAVWSWDGTKWISATSGNLYSAINNVGRNLLHNSMMNVAQRGTGPWSTTSNYTLDRWQIFVSGGGLSITQVPATDANRLSIGDEAAKFLLSATTTGGGGASDYAQLYQATEDVRRLAGKTVTVSFYANSTLVSPKIGVSLAQTFGTGGGASGPVFVQGQSVTLSSTAGNFGRYSLTFAVPVISSVKTVGTSGTDNTSITFWLSSGTTNSASAGGVPVQTGVFNIWGVQLEIGSVATPLEKLDPQQDLAKCQRFYQASTVPTDHAFNSWAASAWMTTTIYFKVQMRAVPQINRGTANLFNITSDGPQQIGVESWVNKFTATAAGATSIQQLWWTASADL